MNSTRHLYGKKIVPHHMLNYAEQIYDILAGEIELGRWKVDERLPGVMHLAKQLGFGTKTVQTAYDRLKEDGYVRTLGYRGTFLKSRHPLSPGSGGKIGVLVTEEQTGQPLILWYEHVILRYARSKGMVTEVRTLPAPFDPSDLNRRGGLFGSSVRGIISLTPFRLPGGSGSDDGRLPVAFLCPPYEPCTPKVCADVREAYYDLTTRLVRGGHRDIVFSEDSVEPDPRQTVMHRDGYLEAMRDHGLPVDEELLEASRKVRNSDPASVGRHLEAIVRRPKARRPTAVVAGSLGRNTALVRVAPRHRVKVPEDLSVVSIGAATVDGEHGIRLSGMLPDFDRMVEMCLAMIGQPRAAGRSEFTQVHVRMHFVEGDTLRDLKAKPAPTVRRRPGRHDPKTRDVYV